MSQKTSEMLSIINSRVRKWQFHDVYQNDIEAKHAAAALFVESNGVMVKKVLGSYAVTYWEKEIR